MESFSLFPDDNKGAIIDPTGRYRYSLWRTWSHNGPHIVWIMLNHSTADAELDDQTIRRCIGFSRAWGGGSLEVVNLFAYRATDPGELLLAADPVGPNNDKYLTKAVKNAHTIIAAWGTHGKMLSRNSQVTRLLKDYVLHCLGTTKDGHPRHPLYVASSTVPVSFNRRLCT